MGKGRKDRKDRKEIKVSIYMNDGERFEKEFVDCEEAWNWERDTRHYHERRRAIKDRRYVNYSLYVGTTLTGVAYGGYLKRRHDPHNFMETDIKNWARVMRRRDADAGGLARYKWLNAIHLIGPPHFIKSFTESELEAAWNKMSADEREDWNRDFDLDPLTSSIPK